MLLGYPIEIWIICVTATLVRLRTSASASNLKGGVLLYAMLSSGFVSVMSGVFLHKGVSDFMELGPASYVFIAAIISLSAESLMSKISSYSEKFDLTGFIDAYLKRKSGGDNK